MSRRGSGYCRHGPGVLVLLLASGLALGSCGLVKTPEPSPGVTMTPTAPSMSPPLTSPSSLIPIAAESFPLSGPWHFAVDPDDAGQDEGWAEPGFDDSGWTAMTVPHTWGVMEEYAEYDGWAWYRRHFALPDEARGAHLRLHFDAVFYLARVWLNGEYLGEHEGGYTPFEFDVSGLVQWGTDNLIAVQVDNRRSMNRIPATLRPGWSFDWWNYGGIVRDVSVQITSRAFIARQQITALPHLDGVDQADVATVTARVTIRNASTDWTQRTITLSARMYPQSQRKRTCSDAS